MAFSTHHLLRDKGCWTNDNIFTQATSQVIAFELNLKKYDLIGVKIRTQNVQITEQVHCTALQHDVRY